jgi:hypothetical protein
LALSRHGLDAYEEADLPRIGRAHLRFGIRRGRRRGGAYGPAVRPGGLLRPPGDGRPAPLLRHHSHQRAQRRCSQREGCNERARAILRPHCRTPTPPHLPRYQKPFRPANDSRNLRYRKAGVSNSSDKHHYRKPGETPEGFHGPLSYDYELLLRGRIFMVRLSWCVRYNSLRRLNGKDSLEV